MIEIFRALDWLNEFDVSNLAPASRSLISLGRDVGLPDSERAAMIRNLQALARVSRNTFEVAEIFLHCAVLEYWRDNFSKARNFARRAIKGYQNDNHREAVARWIGGMSRWKIGENDRAYADWDGARVCFRDCYDSFRNLSPRRIWYEERIQEMNIDLATKPEEIYGWLNRYDGSNLSEQSWDILNRVQKKIRQRDYSEIYELFQMLQDMNRWSRDLYERAEAYWECGFDSYRSGNLPLAIEFLRKAVPEFAPGMGNNHKQVMARWMLGCLEWMGNDAQNRLARNDWMRCIFELDQLRLEADRNNDQNRKKWYADRRAILQDALSMNLKS